MAELKVRIDWLEIVQARSRQIQLSLGLLPLQERSLTTVLKGRLMDEGKSFFREFVLPVPYE